MSRIGTENKIDAARHESAHAVIGFRSGCKPSAIHILQVDDRWLGGCKFEEHTKASAEDYAAIAIAGCLAQVKSVAERQYGPVVRFKPQHGLKELIFILRDADRSTPEAEPGTCDLVLLVDGKDAAIRFDGAWLSGADAGQYRMAREALFPIDSTDQQLIRSVMAELDDEKNWRAVCALGQALTFQSPASDGRLTLDGIGLHKIIEEMDGQDASEASK